MKKMKNRGSADVNVSSLSQCTAIIAENECRVGGTEWRRIVVCVLSLERLSRMAEEVDGAIEAIAAAEALFVETPALAAMSESESREAVALFNAREEACSFLKEWSKYAVDQDIIIAWADRVGWVVWCWCFGGAESHRGRATPCSLFQAGVPCFDGLS
jgi:hypothetical protein